MEIIKINQKYISEIVQIGVDCNLSYWSEEDYHKEMENKNSFCVAALINNQVAGFIIVRTLLGGESEILNFAVREDHRRQGIGARLFQFTVTNLIREFNCDKLFLEVRISNQEAIRFYQTNRFRIAGRRKNFYVHPVEDALLMFREF